MKRLVGLDLGSKSLGVAVSDPLRLSAQGLTTLRFEEDAYKKAIRLLADLLQEYEVESFVLGNPKHMDGSHSDSAQRCLDFKKRLEDKFKVEVILWDERLTSVLVDKMMINFDLSRKKRKQIIDEMAAVNILQGYMDSQR